MGLNCFVFNWRSFEVIAIPWLLGCVELLKLLIVAAFGSAIFLSRVSLKSCCIVHFINNFSRSILREIG